MAKDYIYEDADVYYIHDECSDEPVRNGTVETVHGDGSVDIWDDILGSVTVDEEDVFETKKEALYALANR